MPHTSGVSAVGIWMIACIIMVFGALTEYGIILYIMMSNPCSKPTINQSINSIGFINGHNNFIQDQNQYNIIKEISRRALLRKIDFISSVTFPILSLSFIIGYLIWFMT